MSREIKFRVFDKVSKSMSPPFSLFGEFTMLGAVFAWLDHVRKLPECTCGISQLNEIEMVQFTGLREANGFEIWEGDIVKDHNGVGKVEYSERFAAFRVNYTDPYCKWFYDYNCKGERDSILVIGNIYEHPRLLDGNK